MIASLFSNWYFVIPTLGVLYFFYFYVLRTWLGVQFYKKQGCQMNYFPVIGNLMACLKAFSNTGEFYGHFKQEIKKNPKLRAIGGNFLDKPYVFLVDPVLIKQFLQNQHKYQRAPLLNDLVKIVAGSGLVTTDGEIWKRHRKVISAAFHYDLVRDTIPDTVKTSDQFLEDLKLKDLNEVDIMLTYQTIAGEVIGRLFFGAKFSEYIVGGKPVTAFLADLEEHLGRQGPTLGYLFFGANGIKKGYLPGSRELMRKTSQFQEFARQIIEEKTAALKNKKQAGEAQGKTLIDILLSQREKTTDDAFDTQEIIDEFITFFGAGMDTTGHIIAMMAYFYSQNPQYHERMHEEIDKFFADPSKVTLDDLNQMDFMSAWIKETSRLGTPSASYVDRISLEDHKLGDLTIKKGTLVNLNSIFNNFNPNYHDEADSFKPERWLTDSKTMESMKKEPYVFIPFSSGPRNCIGQHLATAEMKIIFSLFVKKFDFTLKPDYKLRMIQRIMYEPYDRLIFKLTPKSS